MAFGKAFGSVCGEVAPDTLGLPLGGSGPSPPCLCTTGLTPSARHWTFDAFGDQGSDFPLSSSNRQNGTKSPEQHGSWPTRSAAAWDKLGPMMMFLSNGNSTLVCSCPLSEDLGLH